MCRNFVTARDFLNLCYVDRLDTVSVFSINALFSDDYESQTFFFDEELYESYHFFIDDIVSCDLFAKTLICARIVDRQLLLYVDWY